METYPLRPYVPMDDDATTVRVINTPKGSRRMAPSMVSYVSYAIQAGSHYMLTDMIMSPGYWPSTEDDCDGQG